MSTYTQGTGRRMPLIQMAERPQQPQLCFLSSPERERPFSSHRQPLM